MVNLLFCNGLEIGADENNIHFLIQNVPKFSVEVIVLTVKSIIAKEISRISPNVKQILWNGNFGQVDIMHTQ